MLEGILVDCNLNHLTLYLPTTGREAFRQFTMLSRVNSSCLFRTKLNYTASHVCEIARNYSQELTSLQAYDIYCRYLYRSEQLTNLS
jgi:hypothetical protein